MRIRSNRPACPYSSQPAILLIALPAHHPPYVCQLSPTLGCPPRNSSMGLVLVLLNISINIFINICINIIYIIYILLYTLTLNAVLQKLISFFTCQKKRKIFELSAEISGNLATTLPNAGKLNIYERENEARQHEGGSARARQAGRHRESEADGSVRARQAAARGRQRESKAGSAARQVSSGEILSISAISKLRRS